MDLSLLHGSNRVHCYIVHCYTELRIQDELNTYRRRSSHTGTSSLDSSSIYALLSFDSSPRSRCTDCINSDTDSLKIPADRLRPDFCKYGIQVGDNIKLRYKKETSSEAERTSVSSLASAVPNQYMDCLSSVIGKKQLVVSQSDVDASKRAQSTTPENSLSHLSVKDEMPMCNGLMSSSACDDDGILSAGSKKTSLPNDDAVTEQCPEINYRRYSCGDQLAATWWRLLDRATSFSDLRVFPRSLSRLCCSTWRTFTGVKTPCIDVSKVGNDGPPQSCETRLNTSGAIASVGDDIMRQSVSPWWNKSVSPDRRRLIEICSDMENSSLCEDSPRKVDCKRASLDSAQKCYETVTDSQLSDSDSAGSYVSLRVNCKSTTCHKVLHSSLCGDNVPHPCHTDCDIPNDSDTLFSVLEHPTKRGQEHVRKQADDTEEPSSATSIFNCGPPVVVCQSSPCSMCSHVPVQPTSIRPCQSFMRSLSSSNCSMMPSDQLLQSNNGYVNLSLGLQSCSLDRQSVTLLSNSSFPSHAHPAKISTETKTVPNIGNDSVALLDNLAVHVPHFSSKQRLSCDNSVSSNEPEPSIDSYSWKSSNRLLRLIRRGSTKAHKQPVLSARCSASGAECNTSTTSDSISVTVAGNDESLNVHRLPSPNFPPPPVPDDAATSRLFRLCHTSFSENLPMYNSAESDILSRHGDLSVMKSCTAAKKSATLSSSYSAGDKQHYDNQSLKSSMNEMYNDKPSTRIPTHRQRHGQFPLVLSFSQRQGSSEHLKRTFDLLWPLKYDGFLELLSRK